MRAVARSRVMRCAMALMLAVTLYGARVSAHVGSPDVYVRGEAGPYTVFVSVHPPAVVPGAAEVEVRTEDATVTTVAMLEPDVHGSANAVGLQPFAAEKKFVGSAWIPNAAQVWKLRLQVNGSHGVGEMMVPVALPAIAHARWRWVWPVIFGFEGIFLLVGGFIGRRRRNNAIRVRAATLELRPTRAPGLSQALAFVLMACGVVGLVACVWSARRVSQRTLTPAMQITVSGGVMDLKMSRVSGGHVLNDLVLDHGHVMHLFLVRLPEMDVVLHLHPALMSADKDSAEFTETMPPMAEGSFAIYADVVHGDSVTETATAAAGLPMSASGRVSGDDSVGMVAHGVGAGCGSTAVLMDGYRMALTCSADLKAKTGMLLRVSLVDASGNAPVDMADTMGMGGHAAVVSRDGNVFAHIHPMGTVMVSSAMAGMAMPVSNVVEFPYGFPKAGAYRVFVQMKHGAVIETGAFDLSVR